MEEMTIATKDEGELLFAGVGAVLLVAALLDDDDGGLQFRKEVQTLHGFTWSEDHSRRSGGVGCSLSWDFGPLAPRKGLSGYLRLRAAAERS